MHATTAGAHLPRKKMGRQQIHEPKAAASSCDCTKRERF